VRCRSLEVVHDKAETYADVLAEIAGQLLRVVRERRVYERADAQRQLRERFVGQFDPIVDGDDFDRAKRRLNRCFVALQRRGEEVEDRFFFGF